MKTELHLIFDNMTTGKSFTIRIDNPKESLESLDIIDAMDTIIENKLFGDLMKKGAKLIETTVEEVDI